MQQVDNLKNYFLENAKLMLCSKVELNEANSMKLKVFFDKAMALRINLEKEGVEIQDFSNYSNDYITFKDVELAQIDEAGLNKWLSEQKEDAQETLFLKAFLTVYRMLNKQKGGK